MATLDTVGEMVIAGFQQMGNVLLESMSSLWQAALSSARAGTAMLESSMPVFVQQAIRFSVAHPLLALTIVALTYGLVLPACNAVLQWGFGKIRQAFANANQARPQEAEPAQQEQAHHLHVLWRRNAGAQRVNDPRLEEMLRILNAVGSPNARARAAANDPQAQAPSPELVTYLDAIATLKDEEKFSNRFRHAGKEPEITCPVCYEVMDEPVKLAEKQRRNDGTELITTHYFDNRCLRQWYLTNPINPMSRKPFVWNQVQPAWDLVDRMNDELAEEASEILAAKDAEPSLRKASLK